MVYYFIFRLLQYFWEESYILRVTYFLSVFILLAISSGATSNCPNNCVSGVGNDMISSLANTELECSLIHRPLTIPVLLYSQNFPPVVQPYLEHSPYFLHERHFSINCLPVSSHYVLCSPSISTPLSLSSAERFLLPSFQSGFPLSNSCHHTDRSFVGLTSPYSLLPPVMPLGPLLLLLYLTIPVP